MRITGGEARGRKLKTPRTASIRPTASRVREAIFNSLAPLVPGSTVVDLFAGSGIMGIEALSRGAERAVFVEHNPTAVAMLRANLALLGFSGRATVVGEDVFRAIPKVFRRTAAGLVFADPPYGRGLATQLLAELTRVVTRDCWLIIEHHTADALPDTVDGGGGPVLIRNRRYGDTTVSYYRCGRAGREGETPS